MLLTREYAITRPSKAGDSRSNLASKRDAWASLSRLFAGIGPTRRKHLHLGMIHDG